VAENDSALIIPKQNPHESRKKESEEIHSDSSEGISHCNTIFDGE
jgi:hypothetical protein